MKQLLTISAILLLAASISAAQVPAVYPHAVKNPIKKLILPTDNQCVPGSTFPAFDNCNTCTCSSSGLKIDAVCTRTAECCTSYDDICLSGTYFQPGNYNSFCECPSSRLKSEATNCITLPATLPGRNATCIPGTTYSKSNSFLYCECPASGIDQGLSNGGRCLYFDPLPIKCGICTPGADFKKSDGSRCTCPESGLKADTTVCSKEACFPGSIFTRDEFTCTCPDSTNPEEAPCYLTDDICTPGTNFTDQSGASCECPLSGLRSDSPGCLIDPISACYPGSVFTREEDGYICTCPENGLPDQAICYFDDDTTCTPGTTFLNDDGFSNCKCPCSGFKSEAECTAPSCDTPYIEEKGLSCEPGTSFPSSDGCNTCFCPDNGIKKEAGCTRMPCVIP